MGAKNLDSNTFDETIVPSGKVILTGVFILSLLVTWALLERRKIELVELAKKERNSLVLNKVAPLISDLKEYVEAATPLHLPKHFRFAKMRFMDRLPVIAPQTTAELETIAQIMASHPTMRVRIEGFTDNEGPLQKNMALSFQEARAVKLVLMAKGIENERIDIVGLGDQSPIASNATKRGRILNRRVELVLIKL